MVDIGAHAFSDIEGGLKNWLGHHGVIAPLVGATGSPLKGARVFLGLPKQGPSAWPAISVFRMPGGGPGDNDYPVDNARVQIDCWGVLNGKIECFALAKAVVGALLDLPCGTLLSSEVRALGAHGITVPYVPDPSTGRPRYSVNVVIQAQAV